MVGGGGVLVRTLCGKIFVSVVFSVVVNRRMVGGVKWVGVT